MEKEDIIERLRKELKAADAAQELYTNNNMTQEDKLQFQYYEGQMDLLQTLLIDFISETSGI